MTVMQPLARVTTPTLFRLGFAVVGLFGIAVLGMAIHFIFFLNYAFAAVRYPFQLDYGEGSSGSRRCLSQEAHVWRYYQVPVHRLSLSSGLSSVTRLVAMFTHDFLIAGRMTLLVSMLVTGVVALIL